MSKFSDYNFNGQKALIRVDFNVPLDDKFNITDDTRMKATIPTIKKKQPGLDGMRTVFFVLPGHEWRVDSYVENILNRTGAWNEGLERLQGLLLGYEDWQNDWWIQHRLRPAQQAG